MKVLLTYLYRRILPPSEWLKSKNISNDIICTDDPEEAEVIIFVEAHPQQDPYFSLVSKNILFKKYKSKCVLYHDFDLSITTMPTISPSIEKWQYNSKHKRTFHYIARACGNDIIDNTPVNYDTNREYLYSFIGSNTHEIRNKIISIKHSENIYIKDTTGLDGWALNSEEKIEYERNYHDVMDKDL